MRGKGIIYQSRCDVCRVVLTEVSRWANILKKGTQKQRKRVNTKGNKYRRVGRKKRQRDTHTKQISVKIKEKKQGEEQDERGSALTGR